LPVAVVPLWQLAQLVAAVNVLWSTPTPAVHELVDLWQLSHTVCPVWIAVAGRAARWQLEHCAATVTLVCNVTGVHAVVPALWQVSQFEDAIAATVW
jgi:hypothetical protein